MDQLECVFNSVHKKQNKYANYDRLAYWNEYNYVSIVSNKTVWLNVIAYWHTFVIYIYSFQMDAVVGDFDCD